MHCVVVVAVIVAVIVVAVVAVAVVVVIVHELFGHVELLLVLLEFVMLRLDVVNVVIAEHVPVELDQGQDAHGDVLQLGVGRIRGGGGCRLKSGVFSDRSSRSSNTDWSYSGIFGVDDSHDFVQQFLEDLGFHQSVDF